MTTNRPSGPEVAIRTFLETVQLPPPPQTPALACAGPGENRPVQPTNADLETDAELIVSELGFEQVILVYESASITWAISDLKQEVLCFICEGFKKPQGALFAIWPSMRDYDLPGSGPPWDLNLRLSGYVLAILGRRWIVLDLLVHRKCTCGLVTDHNIGLFGPVHNGRDRENCASAGRRIFVV